MIRATFVVAFVIASMTLFLSTTPAYDAFNCMTDMQCENGVD